MQPEFSIRKGTIEDIERIAQILCDAWLFAYKAIIPSEMMAEFTNLPSRTRRIRDNWNPENLLLVAVNGDDLVCGFAMERTPCSLEGYDAQVSSLYIDPDFSRAGVGGALLKSMAAEFCSRGLKTLAIEALAQNEIGCSFYAKHGGVVGGGDEWHGLPCVWFVWDDFGQLIETRTGDAGMFTTV